MSETNLPDTKLLPRHVAIIPDGNRRWAKEQGKKPWEGHVAGARTTEALIQAAREMGIQELSFWGSSLDNLTKRPLEEKQALLEIYMENFARLLESPEIHEHRVRVRCIGHWQEQFPEKLSSLLQKGMDMTRSYERYGLNFFLAYNGDGDMLQAIQGIVQSGVPPESVDEALLKAHLMTAALPPVDLLIRTGNDPHLSAGFMMWETKDAQLYFPECHFPDFGAAGFQAAIKEYQERERRFGK